MCVSVRLCAYLPRYVPGSGLEADDLRRAGVRTASRAVIFAKEYDRETEGNDSEALADADTIFTYSVLEKENPDVQARLSAAQIYNVL